MENMNNMGDWEQNNIVNELTRGKELARQLQMHLNNGSSSSPETREYLVQNILVSYEKVLSMLNWTSSGGAGDQPQPSAGVSGLMLESPPSLNGSPRSEDSDRDQEHRDHASRKRKSLPRWTQQVRVNPGMGLEGPLDDGFSWRKYGQKDILGAKFPRGYYRCTHRNVQGCLATKQVQRSDEDPNIFEITYRGRHTCTQASNVPALTIEKQDQSPNKTNNIEPQHQQQQTNIINQQQTTQDPHDNVLSNVRPELKVITEGLDSLDQPPVFQLQDQVHTFGAHPHVMESSFAGGFSPSFVSPATSGTNYFSVMSPQGGNVNEHDQFGLQQQNYHHHLHHGSSESEIAEIISAATSSATNTPTVRNLDFPFGHHGGRGRGGGGGGGGGGDDQFDPNFTFDHSGFF